MKSPPRDPRLVPIEQFEAGLMRLIRERYKCSDEATDEVRRRFLDWQMDAAEGIPIRIAADGLVVLSDEVLEVLDSCASKSGLRPSM